MSRRASLALLALAGVLLVTASWWLLALWPGGPAVPDWVERTRAACFGSAPDGMPHAGGWVLLVGEPLGMLGFLLVVWGDAVREGLRALGASRIGRGVLATAMLLVAAGAGTAGLRVRELAAASSGTRFDTTEVAGVAQAMDAPAPPLALVAQHGDTVRLEQFRGRIVLLAFAYGHCQTVCPLVVHDAMRAVREARALDPTLDPALLVVTLDPWRDTPSRLPHVAAAWQLPSGARLLGGSVEAVEATLDRWGIARSRDPDTGAITHPTTVHVVDRQGRLAWIAPSDPARLVALLQGM